MNEHRNYNLLYPLIWNNQVADIMIVLPKTLLDLRPKTKKNKLKVVSQLNMVNCS